MKLAVFPVTHPLYILEAVVSVQVPRLPTAFEKMILRMVDAAAEPALSGVTLRGAFEDMLGIPDPESLLQPRLDELTGLGMLEAPAGDSALDALLSAWRWTDNGRAFWRRGRLPGRSRPETVRYVFDPFSDRLAALAPGGIPPGLPMPAAVSLPDEFDGVDLGPRIAASVPTEKHAWWRVGTEVMGVTTSFLETRWRKVELQVDCTSDGTLALSATSDKPFGQWLRNAEPEAIWDNILAPALGANGKVGRESLELGSAIFAMPASGLASVTQQHPEDSMLLVVPNSYRPQASGADLVMLTTSDLTASVLEEPATKEPTEPMVIRIPAPAGLPGTLRRLETRSPQGPQQAVLEGPVKLYWAGQERVATLQVGLSAEASQPFWEPIRHAMEEWLASSARPRELVLGLWFQPPADVMARWMQCSGVMRADEWLSELGEVLRAIQGRMGPAFLLDDQPWTPALIQSTQSLLDRLRPRPSIREGCGLVSASKALPLRRNPLPGKVLSVLEPAETLADLQALRLALGDGKYVLPARLLGKSVRGQLLTEAIQGTRPPSCGPHALARPVEEFASAMQEARRDLPAVLLHEPPSESSVWLGAVRSQPGRLLRALNLLESAIATVTLALDQSEAESVPVLAQLITRLRGVRQWLENNLAPRLPEDQRAVVIDTNSLVDFPDLLGMLKATDVPYVPKRVLEELDGLKQSRSEDDGAQSRAARARHAIAGIDRAGDSVRIEASKRHLCATDWPPTPDNDILSVAVHLSLNPVLLVTSDKNLRQKAKAESIPAISPADYLNTLKQLGGRPSNQRIPRRTPR